jgi:pimeloyl-ACP methyl ester carboxylesterase/O-acetyl-ADP-ribose deacetylase (regulator of RNase III)
VKQAAVIFIHGLFSSSAVWNDLKSALEQDPAVAGQFDLLFFDYASPRLRLNPARRIPDFNVVADKLRGYLTDPPLPYERLVLVTHSQGGLIAQRFLTRMLNDGQGAQLARIRSIVMLACPNNGSDFLLLLRDAFAPILRNRQLSALRPISDEVNETHRRISAGIVHSWRVSTAECPIPVTVYAGEEDNIVTPASARSDFPDALVLPGDHSTIVRGGPGSRVAATLKHRLAKALTEPFPEPAASLTSSDLRAGIPAGSESTITTYQPIRVQTGSADAAVHVIVHSGPIEQITDVDILVSSENTYFEMSQSFKASTSSRLRRTAAIRSPSGAILWDLEADGLHAWLRSNQCAGLRLNPGTIAATDAGALHQHGVKRIYHAAITEPRPGTNDYYVNPDTITEAVHNAFATARSERRDPELTSTLTSICFPLLGSGRGGLDSQTSLRRIWQAVTEELRNDPSWTVHFASWKQTEAEMIYQTLSQQPTR